MKPLNRIISFLLAVSILLSSFAGCSSEKTDDTIYLTKGEFLSYFVYDNNMTSNKYTTADILNSKDGSVEASIVAEWGYIDSKTALDKLDKPVDKETVVTVCANATDNLKEGDIKSIKDSDLLKNPQLIANAYASGLFELEKGYFSGARKMSFADCEEILDKCREYTANFHFEENTEKYEIADDLVTFDPNEYKDGSIIVDFGEQLITENEGIIENERSNASITDSIHTLEGNGNNTAVYPEETKVGSKDSTKEDDSLDSKDKIIENTASVKASEPVLKKFRALIEKNMFEKDLKNPKIGDKVNIPCYNPSTSTNPAVMTSFGLRSNKEMIGILKSKSLVGMQYDCSFDVISFEEAVTKKNVTEANKSGIKDLKIEKKEVAGWKLTFNTDNGSLKISASKDFSVNETGRKQGWQNSKKTINAKADFSIGDFNIDCKNLKSFATKSGNGWIKMTCDKSFDFSLSTSLRYTPDSNRNGKFPSNWNNSRWTDKDSKGAKEIKIARFTPSLYGIVGGEIYIYLRISIDGKISFGTSVDDGGVIIKTNNGNTSKQALGKKQSKLEAKANLTAKLGVEASLTIFCFIKVIKYDVGLQLDLNIMANLYYKNKISKKGVYADEEGLDEYKGDDSKFNYCLGITYSLDLIGELKESGVKLILDCLGHGDALDFTFNICSGSWHYEDGHTTDKCTRGDDLEKNMKTSEKDDIKLNTYKVTLEQYSSSVVDLKELPSKTKDMYNSKNAITVKSNDEKIAKATYDKSSNSVRIEAVGEGSTKIKITAKKGFWWWKETVEQYVSVTVTGYNDSIITAA